ncbi:MAG: hypothetical protein RLZZ387_1045 [Chloroflexota bacterium]|jgi:sirohydrochlorin cobaltochelatase
MIRLAGRARALGVAPIVAACFLTDARPTFAEALEACVARSASELVLLPYALSTSRSARGELERLRGAARALHPQLRVSVAQGLNDHPAVAKVLLQRASEADYVAAHPFLSEHVGHREDVGEAWRPLYLRYPVRAGVETQRDVWQPMYASHLTALLLCGAAGTGLEADRALTTVALQVRRERCYTEVQACTIGRDQPGVSGALAQLRLQGIRHAIAVPYALHRADPIVGALAAEAAAARELHSDMTLLVAEDLGYDRRLVEAIADRVAEAGPLLARASG